MRRNILVVISVWAGILCAFSQSGVWSGSLEVRGLKIPIVFHLDEGNPTVDSPSQGVKGLPVQFSRSESGIVSIKIPAIGASFDGKFDDDKIIGTFTQGGMKFPLNLTAGETALHRPQTPEPPYPYSQENVSFSNGDAVLKGTLTLPEGYKRETPVVIMITGSGLQNRDEEIHGHKPFAVIADYLAKNGIASLRYDDRGFGESTGDAANCTTEDLMNDALAGIDLLRERFDRVGVLGHSEGGTIALMMGANHKVDFLISLAGMVISGKELLMEQNRHALSQAGYPGTVVDEYCRLITLAFDGDESVAEKLEISNMPAELKNNLRAGLVQIKSPYIQYFLALDVREKLGKIKSPVLALNGTKDTQVFQKNNLEALIKGLPSNGYNKIMAMEGLNHMFQHCQTGSVTEYATIEETVSPEVLETITQWINSLSPVFFQRNGRESNN